MAGDIQRRHNESLGEGREWGTAWEGGTVKVVLNMLRIVSAEYLHDYKVLVNFNDGENRVFDFLPVIQKYTVFKVLENIELLKSFILTDTLEWNNGELDIAPEYIYKNGIPA